MKKKAIVLICLAALSFTAVESAKAVEHDPAAVAADALVARPLCFAGTIIGGVIFVIALPVAATSGSIDSTADALVLKPAWATFRRPLGDFNYSEDYAKKWPGKQEPRLTHHPKRTKKT